MVEELSFEQQDVGHCCHILKVSRSGYYDWLHRPLSLRKSEDQSKSSIVYVLPTIKDQFLKLDNGILCL
jgi:hypothetical protein